MGDIDIPAIRERAEAARADAYGTFDRMLVYGDSARDVPALLDELEAAQARVRELEATVQRVDGLLPDDPTRNAGWVSTDELAWALRGSDD